MKGYAGVVSAACDVVTNVITGTVVANTTAVGRSLENLGGMFLDMGNAFLDVGEGIPVDSGRFAQGMADKSRAIGENLFSMVYAGTDVNAVIAAGVDTGRFMVSLFSGNTASLEEDAKKMGMGLVNVLVTNQIVKIAEVEFTKFGEKAGKAFWEMQRFVGDSDEAEWIAVNIFGMESREAHEERWRRFREMQAGG
jgi:hypothetical protein